MNEAYGKLVTVSSRVGKTGCTISLNGRFGFSAFIPFREAYRAVPADNRFVIDFSNVHYADSAALGMLLLLRDYTGDAARIELAGCRAQPEQVLRIARMHEVFKFI